MSAHLLGIANSMHYDQAHRMTVGQKVESHRDDCFSQAAPHKPMTGGHGLGASQHPMSRAHGVTRDRGRVT